MRLHVTALFIHTIFLAFFQACVVLLYKTQGSVKWTIVKAVAKATMFTSQSVSQIIVIYLFQLFAIPVSLKKDVQEEDDEYEEEFDRARDPNADMMFYVKNMPKVKR